MKGCGGRSTKTYKTIRRSSNNMIGREDSNVGSAKCPAVFVMSQGDCSNESREWDRDDVIGKGCAAPIAIYALIIELTWQPNHGYIIFE